MVFILRSLICALFLKFIMWQMPDGALSQNGVGPWGAHGEVGAHFSER